MATDIKNVLDDYGSIGELYQETLNGSFQAIIRNDESLTSVSNGMTGIKIINQTYKDQKKPLFLESSFTKQFQTADGSWYDDEMTVIRDIDDAVESMTIIIEQGEGSTGEPVKNTIKSHYEVFKDLCESLDHPLLCYDVPSNPKTSDYVSEKPYKVRISSLLRPREYGKDVLDRLCWRAMQRFVALSRC